MEIAVTGASGFVGRHVLAALPEEHNVIAITRDASRLAGLSKNIRVVQMDISQAGSDCFDRLGRPDVLIHLAWDGLPNYRSAHHLESELPSQFRFLKQMVDGGLGSLFVTGTCFEYGLRSGELSEDMPTSPDNPYGQAKNALREQLISLQAIKPFNLCWARLFYMYGDGQPKTSLYSQLKDAVLRKEASFNMSGGEQLRDYLPIAEVAHYIVRLALAQKKVNSTVNICSGQPIKVRDLVEQWLNQNGWNIKLNLGRYPYPDYEPMEFWGSRSLLDAVLQISK